MIQQVRTLTAAMLIAAAAAPAFVSAHDYSTGDITIDHPWSRPTPPGTPMGVGYMVIHNGGDQPVTLMAGQTPAAERVSIHETMMQDGMMKMQPLKDGLTVPAGGMVELKPHSYHLMLEGLREPLVSGEMVPLSLSFDGDRTIDVKLKVESMDKMGDKGGMSSMDHSAH